MGLSEPEVEARLAILRRQRERLDHEIADLVLYLELGRRLGAHGRDRSDEGGPASPEPTVRHTMPPNAADLAPVTDGAGPWGSGRTDVRDTTDPATVTASPRDPAPVPTAETSTGFGPDPGTRMRRGPAPESAASDVPPQVAFAQDASGARRYGRALIEAARAILAEAGRPLHAGEILGRLADRGFSVPGRDPVAALNTRLWKRAGDGGPFRRVGEATYALSETSGRP